MTQKLEQVILKYLNDEEQKTAEWLKTLHPAQAVVLPRFYVFFLEEPRDMSVLYPCVFAPDIEFIRGRYRNELSRELNGKPYISSGMAIKFGNQRSRSKLSFDF